jgi:probable HAF family extracellular repeat protein
VDFKPWGEKRKIMPIRTFVRITAVTILAALAVPLWMAAQDNPSPDNKPKHKKYKLIVLGTFGGPASELTTNNGIGAGAKILNNSGTLTGSADTPVPNPYFPNCFGFTGDCFVTHAFKWERGVQTDLGALPGVNSSQGTGINESGLIAGVSQTGVVDPILGIGVGHAVVWRGGNITDLGTLGGYQSFAVSLNNAGEVVALSTVDGPLDPYSFLGQSIHAFFWRNGTTQDVGTLGGPDTFPGLSYRLVGAVVGASFTNSTPNPTTGIPTLHPFLWRNDQLQDLGTLGGTFGEGTVANSRGQIAGDSTLAGDLQDHPFLWDKGKLTDLGTLGGDNGGVHNIGDNGDVVGFADLPGSQAHDAFLWRHGVMSDLGNLGVSSAANAGNSRSQVVGHTRIDSNPDSIRAFLWEDGGPMVNLNDLVPQNSPLLLLDATDINERGEVAGVGVPAGCDQGDYLSCGRAFLLIPDGDCDQDNERRIAGTEAWAELVRQVVPAITGTIPPLSPAERIRSMMWQRYHLPGQPAAPRD